LITNRVYEPDIKMVRDPGLPLNFFILVRISYRFLSTERLLARYSLTFLKQRRFFVLTLIQGNLKMNKLLAVLVAGLFSAGAFAAASAPAAAAAVAKVEAAPAKAEAAPAAAAAEKAAPAKKAKKAKKAKAKASAAQ